MSKRTVAQRAAARRVASRRRPGGPPAKKTFLWAVLTFVDGEGFSECKLYESQRDATAAATSDTKKRVEAGGPYSGCMALPVAGEHIPGDVLLPGYDTAEKTVHLFPSAEGREAWLAEELGRHSVAGEARV